MKNLDDLMSVANLLKKEEDKTSKKIVIALAIVGAVTAVAAIAYAVYSYMTPDYLDDFEDDFDDDFDDDIYDDDDDPAPTAK